MQHVHRHVIGHRIFIITITVALSTFLFLTHAARQMNGALMDLAALEARNLATAAINEALRKTLIELESASLISDASDDPSQVQLTFNAAAINHQAVNLTKYLQTTMYQLATGSFDKSALFDYPFNVGQGQLKKGIFYQLPLGMSTANPLLAQLGPHVPVRMALAGDVEQQTRARVNNYGINNILVEIVATVKIRTLIYLPYAKRIETIEQEVLLAMHFLQGAIPLFYQGNYPLTNSINIPTTGG